MLPILHLNGYKIANPTVLARISQDELESLFRGYGYKPHFLEGDEPFEMHQRMAATLDTIFGEIHSIQKRARKEGHTERPRWPMLILRTPKGWTGPKVVDGKPVEGTWRAHQVPVAEVRENPEHLKILEEWMKSYRPEELFDPNGKLDAGPRRAASQGTAAHGDESARQRRFAARTSAPSVVPQLRRRRENARQP